MTFSFCAVLAKHPADVPGGAEYQAHLIAQELATKDNETHYVAYDSGVRSRTDYEGVTVHRLGDSDTRGSLLDTLETIDADVYYFRLIQDLPKLWRAKRRLNGTFVYNISRDIQCKPLRSSGPYSNKKGFVGRAMDIIQYAGYRTLLRIPDVVFTQTEYQCSLLAEHRGIESTVVGNGHPVPDDDTVNSSPPVVLWLANLKSVKRPEQFVRVAKALRDFDVEFWMVGHPVDDELAANVRESAKDIDALSYKGGCGINESNQYFSKASVFVHTGNTEGYPNTFIQAWLHRTPVVSLCTNPDEVFDQFQVGVHCSSEHELQSAVRKYLNEPDLRMEAGKGARKYAAGNHSISAVVDKVEARLSDSVL